MALTCGIIGLPNAGKSTLFNALTSLNVAAEAYPFCTIEPNTGVVPVPDRRLSQVASVAGCSFFTQAYVKFIDLAGLVKGASKGEGLGNRFLAKTREAELLVHVLRAFKAGDVSHVCLETDPLRDSELVNLELLFADLETVESRGYKLERKQKSGDRAAKREADFLARLHAHLEKGDQARSMIVAPEEEHFLADLQLLTAKKVIYLLNVGEKENIPAFQIEKFNERAAFEDIPVLTVSAQLEAELAELPVAEREEFLQEYGYTRSGLSGIIKTCYEQLGLIAFFTVKGKEARAWMIRAGSRAIEAAGKVHSDMQQGFIAAETINWEKLVSAGSVAGAKSAGAFRLEGKNYRVQDGDVIFFRFGV